MFWSVVFCLKILFAAIFWSFVHCPKILSATVFWSVVFGWRYCSQPYSGVLYWSSILECCNLSVDTAGSRILRSCSLAVDIACRHILHVVCKSCPQPFYGVLLTWYHWLVFKLLLWHATLSMVLQHSNVLEMLSFSHWHCQDTRQTVAVFYTLSQ